jgi:nicotinamidase-related amidase
MNNALIVIDFINDIIHPQGKLAHGAKFLEEHQTIKNVNRAILHARKEAWLLIFVKVGFSKNYIECPRISPIFASAPKNQVLQLDSWGTAFFAELDYQPQDYMIVKHRVSPFYGTDLDLLLRTHHIETVYVSGFSTDMAVQSAVKEGHDRDYKMVVITDACGAFTDENHQCALHLMQRLAEFTKADNLI